MIRRAVTDMQASMSRARDNLKRNNMLEAKNEMEAIIDLSQLLAQSVQEILASLDQLEELYSMQRQVSIKRCKTSAKLGKQTSNQAPFGQDLRKNG